jgi:hypothetical protein
MTPPEDQPIERICRGCRVMFVIEPGEVRFFRARQLFLPWHCPACRDARRLQREATDFNTSDKDTIPHGAR